MCEGKKIPSLVGYTESNIVLSLTNGKGYAYPTTLKNIVKDIIKKGVNTYNPSLPTATRKYLLHRGQLQFKPFKQIS